MVTGEDVDSLVKRLELIKTIIQLGEVSSLEDQAEKLRESASSDDKPLKDVSTALSEERYSEAVSLINDYLQSEAAIQEYTDPRLSALRLEAEALEQRLVELESTKTEIEREIHEFNLRHEQELGTILEEILEIQAERKRNRAEEQPENEEAQAEYEEARQEYEEYSKAVEEVLEERRIELTTEEKRELKELYRNASKQCHPDAVEEIQEEEAQEIFIELQRAYEENDLDAVREIVDRIEKGAFSSRSAEIDEVATLEAEVQRLQRRVEELRREIEALKSSDAYQTISDIDNFDEYFEEAREKRLRSELDRLRKEERTSV